MKIRNYIYKIKGYILGQIILSILATISLAFIPVCNEYLVDHCLINKNNEFGYLVAAYIFIFLFFLITTWGSERLVWKCAIIFENSLKKACYDAILKLPYIVFKKKKSDEYLSMLTNNITSIEQDYLQPICALIKSSFSVLVYIIIISIYTSPIICIALLFLSLLAAFSPKIYKKKLRIAGKNYIDQAADYTKKTSDLLDGAELVNANTRVAFSCENSKSTNNLSIQRLKLGKAKVNGNTISGAAVCLIDVIIFVLCGFLVMRGKITVGIVVAAITYAKAFTEPVQEILYDINTLNSSRDIVKNLEIMMDEIDVNEKIKDDEKSGDIVLNDVCVSLQDKKIIYNVKFDVGKKYLITGASGKGKTTLLDTITGRKTIERGDCKVKDNYYYLSQHQHVFNDNAFNNISIFGSFSNLKEIDEADIPMYERVKKERDCSILSGGEKQILKICRMLVQRKPVLIMDEPFAGVDNSNSNKLFHMLSKRKETMILVSHETDFELQDLNKWKKIRIEDICYEEL